MNSLLFTCLEVYILASFLSNAFEYSILGWHFFFQKLEHIITFPTNQEGFL